MADPIFKLEKVVKAKEDMEDFEGPLTLILQLLGKNKIEIKDISISSILSQYIRYLEEMAEMDLEIASEFITMASHLMFIKTKVLLSGDEDVSELEQLISSLENLRRRDIYVQMKEVTEKFLSMYKLGGGLFIKPPEYFTVDREYKYSHEKGDLMDAMLRVMDKMTLQTIVENIKTVPLPSRNVYPVTTKAEEIIKKLKLFGVMHVKTMFAESRDRTELVATFMALLELCKAGSIFLSGDGEELTVSYTGTGSWEISPEYEAEGENNGDS